MMKKLLLLLLFIGGINLSTAQEKTTNVDFSLGLLQGDVSDIGNRIQYYTGLSLTYFISEVAEELYLGVRGGYSHYAGDNEDAFGINRLHFATLAGVINYHITDELYVRLDLGYAIGIGNESNNAPFFEPRIGYNLHSFSFFGFYQSVLDSDISIGAIGLGIIHAL